MNRVWILVLGFLAQFARCADRHLQWPRLEMEPVTVARLGEVRDVGMIGDDQFILISGEPDHWQPRTLVRIDAGGNERSLVLPTRDTPRCYGEALIVRGPRWHYSRCIGYGVQFVGSDSPGSPSFVASGDPGQLDPREWLPFPQDEPGGVLLSVKADQRTVIARRVTASGIQETLGRFDRGSTGRGSVPGKAVLLGSDRVALITIEAASSDPSHSSIVLRVIENGEIATARVATHEGGWASIAAAAGSDEKLAIVAAPFDASGVIALVVDPAQPDQATIRHLTKAPVAGRYPGLRLIAHGDRFIASWIRSGDRSIQIAEFDGRVVLPAVTVADHAGGLDPMISLGHLPGEDARDVTVFWTDDGGNVMLRRLPEPPTGFLIASELLRAFSDWAAGRAQQAHARP